MRNSVGICRLFELINTQDRATDVAAQLSTGVRWHVAQHALRLDLAGAARSVQGEDHHARPARGRARSQALADDPQAVQRELGRLQGDKQSAPGDSGDCAVGWESNGFRDGGMRRVLRVLWTDFDAHLEDEVDLAT